MDAVVAVEGVAAPPAPGEGDESGHGADRDRGDLVAALHRHVNRQGENPPSFADYPPFVWTARATVILEKVGRASLALGEITSA